MGQVVRNITISGKVLSFEGVHGGTYDVVFDDVTNGWHEGAGRGNARPVKAASITISQATGKGSYDTTPQAFTGGTLHSVRLVDPNNGQVTLRSNFIAG